MARRLRIAVLEAGRYASSGGVVAAGASHREIDALIRRYLPAAAATLFAEPRPSADGREVAWYSDLAGQPVPLVTLPPTEQAPVRERLATRLTALAALAERLRAESPAAAGRLDAALRYPGDETVYVVGGEPVLTFWGHQAIGRPPLGPPLPTAKTPAAPADAIATAPIAEPARRLRVGHRVLLSLLALLALGAAGFGLWQTLGWGWWWPPWGPDYAALLAEAENAETALAAEVAALERSLGDRREECATDAALDAARTEGARLEGSAGVLAARVAAALGLCQLRAELAAAEADGRVLDTVVARARARLASSLDACRVAAEEQHKAAEQARAAAQAKAVARDAERKAAAERAKKVDAQKPPSETPPVTVAEEPPETTTREPTKRADGLPPCPGERTAEEAPDVALVLDASGSMGSPASVLGSEIQQLMRQLGGPAGMIGSILFGQMPGGPSRLDEAKRGVNSVVRSLPDDVDVGMMVLRQCPTADSLGSFSPAERGRLLASVQRLQPTQGTPLAQGLRGAGKMVDGVGAPGVVVVISDGEDSCGGDPCAAARALKMQKPQLTINVVDILGNSAGACIAAATGGRVISPDSGLEFEKAIRDAAEQAMKPAHCP